MVVGVANKTIRTLYVLICIFLIPWLAYDLWLGLSAGEIHDLRTSNELSFEDRPIWFAIVFVLKASAIFLSCYYLSAVFFKKTKE